MTPYYPIKPCHTAEATRQRRQELENLLLESENQMVELQKAKDEADMLISGVDERLAAPSPPPMTPSPTRKTVVDTPSPLTVRATESQVADNLAGLKIGESERLVPTPIRPIRDGLSYDPLEWEDGQGGTPKSPVLTPTELEEDETDKACAADAYGTPLKESNRAVSWLVLAVFVGLYTDDFSRVYMYAAPFEVDHSPQISDDLMASELAKMLNPSKEADPVASGSWQNMLKKILFTVKCLLDRKICV